jgi:hypothetical protein
MTSMTPPISDIPPTEEQKFSKFCAELEKSGNYLFSVTRRHITDAMLAAGEDPSFEPMLALRTQQVLYSMHQRAKLESSSQESGMTELEAVQVLQRGASRPSERVSAEAVLRSLGWPETAVALAGGKLPLGVVHWVQLKPPFGPLDPDLTGPWPVGTEYRPGHRARSYHTGRRGTVMQVYQEGGAQRMSVLLDGHSMPTGRVNPASFFPLSDDG